MKTQKEQILSHLMRGWKITTLQATLKYNITCLAERIRDLKEDGHAIGKVMVESNGRRYAEYRIEG